MTDSEADADFVAEADGEGADDAEEDMVALGVAGEHTRSCVASQGPM